MKHDNAGSDGKAVVPDAAAASSEQTGSAQTSMRRDLPLMYVAQVLRYVAPMILVPFYGRRLGIESYGHLLSAMALMQIVWLIIEWGLPSTGFRDTATAESASQLGNLLGKQTAARLLLASLVAPVALVAVILTPALNTDVLVSSLALALGVVSAFNMTWYLQGVGRFRLAAVIEVLGLTVSTLLILTWVRSPSDAWIIPGTLLGVGACSSLLQFCLAAARLPRSSIKFRHALRTIRDSTLLFLDRGQTLMLGPLCVFLVGFVAPVAAVAAFAVADRLMGVALAFLNPLNQFFSVQVARSVTQMQQGAAVHDTHRLIRKVCRYSLSLHALVAGLGLMSADFVIPLIFGHGFEPVIAIFRVLCVALLFFGCVSVGVGNVLYPLRHDRDMAMLASVRLVATCFCVVVLAATSGAMGAAIGRLLGAVLTLVVLVIIFRRRSLWSIFRPGERTC